MNFKFKASPLPLPPIFHEASTLKLILGLCLFLLGVLIFSLWKERVYALKEEERAKFIMFHIFGGSWLIAIFAVCGGIYFLFDSIYRLTA